MHTQSKLKMVAAASAVVGSLISSAAFAGPNDGPHVAPKAPLGTVFGSATLWAVVNADGTVARSDGHVAAKTGKIAGFTGAYQVGFFRNVRGCAYIATVGGSQNLGTPPDGFVVVEGRFDNNNGVFLQTYDHTGVEADRGFHLFVNC